jgi:aspartate ammonia-lyase
MLKNVQNILAKITGKPMKLATNLVAATSSMQGFSCISSALKNFAVTLSKINSDLIFLASGPTCRNIRNQLTCYATRIFYHAGKVNPVMPEVMNCVCYKVIGNDATVTMASQDGLLQLNAYEPVVAVAIFESQHCCSKPCRYSAPIALMELL